MAKVNITPAMRKMAEAAGMFIEYDTRTFTVGDTEHTCNTVVIGEESSDFYVEYGIARLGVLFHIVSPDYVEDLPAHIDTTAKLRQVVKYLIQCCEDAN